MAIFTMNKIVLAATALATLTSALPLAFAPRDVTSIQTETAYTTVDVPVTLWVDEKGNHLSTVGGEPGVFAPKPSEAPKVEPSAYSSPTTTSYSAVQTTPVVSSTPANSPASPNVVPTTTPVPIVNAVPTTTPPPAALSTISTSAVQVPTTTTTTPAPAATNKASSGQTGTTYIGDITHYDGGLGACGWSVNTETEMQIALPFGMMGEQSNGNPYCGKSLTIKNPNTGATAQATVGDKCMGCTGASIDLTNLLFNTIGGGCDGRCSGFEWWFN